METIRPIAAGESALFRDVRLRALADAPDAFESTLAKEAAEPDAWWEDTAERAAAGDDLAIFLALAEDGTALGSAGGFRDRTRTGTAMLWGMWVDPAARRRGLGRRLAAEVERWARMHGFGTLTLWVEAGNEAAVALYTELGFRDAGEEKQLGSNPALRERRLAKIL